MNQWEIDSKIDITQLEESAQNIPRLHVKYLRIHSQEKMKLKKTEAQLREFRLAKHEHYYNGPSEETKHWKLAPKGRVLKSETERYIDGDEDVNKKQLEVDYSQEKVDTLDSILKMIHQRQYTINMIMQHVRWQSGG